MLTVYNIIASGGQWEDAYQNIVASFTKEEDAQRYLEAHCTLEGQEMQALHGKYGDNYLWWKKKEKEEWHEVESWTVEQLTVYESLEEEQEDQHES